MLEHWLHRFRELRKPGPYDYGWCHSHDGGRHGYHVVFSSMIHGNEVGSLPGLVQVMEALATGELDYGGRVSFFVGNPEAGRLGKRFLDADLNRVFLERSGPEHEVIRAREIMPVLEDCDLYVDFHQTILATATPFYIMVWREDLWHWARAIGATSAWVTSAPGQSFSPGTRCADEYVRFLGRPALTIELSQAGFEQEAASLAARSITRTLGLVDQLQAGAALDELAAAQPELTFYETVHREPFASPRCALRPGLTNFQDCEEGQLLSGDGSPMIRAPRDGKLLFPKYPDRDAGGEAIAPYPRQIFHVVQPMEEHPLACWSVG